MTHTESSPQQNPGGSTTIQSSLIARRDAGEKSFIPYLTGGYGPWLDFIRVAMNSGSDAVEVGIPFSDPVMDGTVIQASSEVALRDGTTPQTILDAIAETEFPRPIGVMTYANLVYRYGWQRFADELVRAGISGAILADIPLEELGPWQDAASKDGIEQILLAAPTADDERLGRIVSQASGFVYAVGLLGITGERTELAASATVIAKRLKAMTDVPVLVGIGVSTPQQAVQVCEVADGVVVGSAIVRRAMETQSVDAVGELIGEFRAALDRG